MSESSEWRGEGRAGDTGAPLRWWEAMVWPALAGGMGWGIRGQYGHETGAMMAGLLVGLTLALLWCARWSPGSALRAAALMTVGIGFGGSETYGQTVGLTHDAELVGNGAALGWGLLGLAIKGGVWIGFAGAFLGIGLGGVRYRPLEMLAIFVGLVGLMFVGIWLCNEPYDPGRKILPTIYFSDDWRWEPDAMLKPRRERWGGLLFALLGLIAYAGWVRRDRLTRNLAGWAMLAGAIGFPLGQCLQAFHAWNRGWFQAGPLAGIDPFINWWNLMETTFGALFGAVLGLGVWLNRDQLREPITKEPAPDDGKSAPWEWGLVTVYVPLLICWEFFDVPVLNALAEPGITMGLLPAVALMFGRWWPYWMTMPLTLIPIVGKTVRQLAYREQTIAPMLGWAVYVVVPVLILIVLCSVLGRREARWLAARRPLAVVLLVNVWLYYGLNHAFFHYPWPWQAWTVRTAHDLVYLGCALGLTWRSLRS